MTRRVLLVQDDPTDAGMVRDALAVAVDPPYELEWVRRCDEGLEVLAGRGGEGPLTAMLVDLNLADSRGLATFERLFRAAPDVPMLVLAANGEEDVARLAMQRGAQDYLLKDRLDSYLLSKALRGMRERAVHAEALFNEKERAQVTLDSIGDAVISTDVNGLVTFLNSVAEGMTGWGRDEAVGRPMAEIFRIVDSTTRETMPDPMARAIRENRAVALTPNSVLIRRDGAESAVEDTAAPIHDRGGHVTGAVMVFHDVSSSRKLSMRMSHLAQHDSLTDLPNRLLLKDRLVQALALAQRHAHRLALLFVDVDRFKHINDSLGHAIGDRLLQSIADRLLASVRGSDTVSRQGGDEFVVLLSEVARAQDASVSAERILLSLGVPHRIDQHDLHLSVSIGIVTYPEDGTDAETLLRNADAAMYHAKQSGRGNFQFFRPAMNLRAIERQSLESALRQALQRGEFSLQYQPRIDLDSGEVIGVEALLRWNSPERGVVLPAHFMPVAEDCGLMVPIGRFVLREACQQARAWQDAGLPPISVAVNISAAELRARDFVEALRTILADTRLEARYLELELTESFLLQESKYTVTVLQALKSLGLQLTLDDFGTGYSSLTYLKRFPIDALKIDRSFVRDITTDKDDASIVAAVVGMGSNLKMRVVAEGVETREQLAFLRQCGCTQAQGFYFSRPLEVADFTRLLRHGAGADAPMPILGYL